MDRMIRDLYGEYACGGANRREFFERLTQVAGSAAAAAALVPVLGGSRALAQIVPEGDNRLTAGPAGYDAAGTKINGYLARLKAGGKRPAVLVIHENRGLTPHIKDVARRFAVEGFLAFAPDMLTPLGGTPANESEGPALIGKLDAAETVTRLAAAVAYLATHPESNGKVGVVGFCWGGGMVNRLAAAGTALKAAVPYYGPQIPATDVPRINCPMMLHYGALDTRINAGIEAYEAALKANNKIYEKYIYEGANHAFNNDTSDRYNKPAADLAWSRTVGFFKKYLT